MKDLYEKKCKKIYWLRPSYSRRRNNYAIIASCILLVPVAVYAFLFMFLIDTRFDLSVFSGQSILQLFEAKEAYDDHLPLDCLIWNQTSTCPKYYPTSHKNLDGISVKTCPDYFRWIHEDLRHWRDTGITREMVEVAGKSAHFRLAIVEGKAYIEKFRKSFQTRDLFTMWGFQQLLRRYPGRVPDLELMFDCGDRPVLNIKPFRGPNPGPPPLFSYCSDPWSLDIVMPDWSFWGWAETNQKPWDIALKDIKEGNKRVKWKDREPYAYWKGNPSVSPIRMDLLKCNVNHTSHLDWDTRLFVQDWKKESTHGFKQSNVQDQCTHRYKIYVEGWGWSVSEKYILACDSPTLYITLHYYSFFARGLEPLKHFWPIRETDKCKSLKFAVEWGNNHTSKAQEMGKESSRFTQDDMNMEHVYDYMLHLLTEYAKLLRFKPSVPTNAMELCSESMVCLSNGIWKKFMEDSLVQHPAKTNPCTLPPPYDPTTIKDIIDNRTRTIRQVEMWEDEYWKNQPPI
uniref:protein O-glucosyltransferase 1-like n=1 Tax=Erigeron canadensis TaxID=72917 RepID=UPI001CB90384|nr:protein O-glucosyltransferase 1-like [Erigeron canadensis]